MNLVDIKCSCGCSGHCAMCCIQKDGARKCWKLCTQKLAPSSVCQSQNKAKGSAGRRWTSDSRELSPADATGGILGASTPVCARYLAGQRSQSVGYPTHWLTVAGHEAFLLQFSSRADNSPCIWQDVQLDRNSRHHGCIQQPSSVQRRNSESSNHARTYVHSWHLRLWHVLRFLRIPETKNAAVQLATSTHCTRIIWR